MLYIIQFGSAMPGHIAGRIAAAGSARSRALLPRPLQVTCGPWVQGRACPAPGMMRQPGTAAHVAVTRSRVTIEGGRIRGEGTALMVSDSSVTATGLRVEGETALLVGASRLDLAGVTLIGRAAAVSAERPSTLLFSVSRGESPHFRGSLHGVRRIEPGRPL